MAVKFEKTINLGTVVSFAMLMIVLLKAWSEIGTRITSLEVRMEPVWSAFVAGRR